MKKILIVLSVLFIFSSCEESQKDVEIVFVYDKSIEFTEKYPSYFLDLTLPYSSECEMEVFLKPVGINRLDISNKTVNIGVWDFMSSDAGEKTVEFCTNWISTYYKDSMPNSLLFDSAQRVAELDVWMSKAKDTVLIYSEESNAEEYNGRQIFTDLGQLKTKLKELICKNQINKVYILINPTLIGSQHNLETPKLIDQQSTGSKTNTVITNTKVVKTESTVSKTATSSPCPNRIAGSSLDDCFRKLADANIPRECKTNLKSQVIGYFESPSSKVVNVDNNGSRISGEWTISSYCESIMTSHRPTFIYGKESNGSKISTLKINR